MRTRNVFLRDEVGSFVGFGATGFLLDVLRKIPRGNVRCLLPANIGTVAVVSVSGTGIGGGVGSEPTLLMVIFLTELKDILLKWITERFTQKSDQ